MAHHHGTAPPRPRQPWNNLRPARGLPAEAPRRAGDLRLARGSLSRALRGPSAQGKLRLARAPLGRLRWQPNLPTGRGAFTRQPLHSMGRESDGVRRRKPTSITMPHSERDRRLLNLHPPLCHYSRCGAGLRHPVRTCLTPPATVLPTPCTFLPCRTLDPSHPDGNALRVSTTLDSK